MKAQSGLGFYSLLFNRFHCNKYRGLKAIGHSSLRKLHTSFILVMVICYCWSIECAFLIFNEVMYVFVYRTLPTSEVPRWFVTVELIMKIRWMWSSTEIVAVISGYRRLLWLIAAFFPRATATDSVICLPRNESRRRMRDIDM